MISFRLPIYKSTFKIVFFDIPLACVSKGQMPARYIHVNSSNCLNSNYDMCPKVSSSSLSPDLISRGMQIEPQNLQQQHHKQQLPSVPQSASHVQDKSSSLVSRPPTSSTLAEDRHLYQQTTAQFISRDEVHRSGTPRSTNSSFSKATGTETSDLNSKYSTANFNGPIQENFDRSRPEQSAATSLPSKEQAASQLKPAPDAPRLPYPDIGGLFREGWDDQQEKTASQPNESNKDEPSPGQGAPLTAKSSFVMDDHVQNSTHRPFSFMELSSHKTHEPVQEILQHVRRHEAKSGDRDPSPVSPQRSLHDQVVSAQRNTSDEFLPSEKQLELAMQSSSYHFHDPNLHEHPAFRHGDRSADNSSPPTDHVPVETPLIISGKESQQFPPAVPPHGVIANSWRNANDPPSLPALSAPDKAGEPTPINGSGQEDSQFKAPIAPKIKTKRASLFRSLNGRGGKDHDSGRDPRETTTSPPATHTEPHHENTKTNTKTNESSKAHNKLQRSSSAAIAEQESGKKKRFSVLGVSWF